MNRLTKIPSTFSSRLLNISARMMSDKKSGSANSGSIAAAGGKFAERESAFENEYFHKLQAEQLKKLKDHIHTEIEHSEAEIKRHQELIKRHKQRATEIDRDGQKK